MSNQCTKSIVFSFSHSTDILGDKPPEAGEYISKEYDIQISPK